MDYEQKYKEALERIQGLLDNAKKQGHIIVRVEDIEDSFPELKESEDEKWRKWLIGHLKGYINQTDDKYAEVCKKAIAWLENQKKTYTMNNIININGIDYMEIPAKTNDKICKDCDYFLDNGKCLLTQCPCKNDDGILKRI